MQLKIVNKEPLEASLKSRAPASKKSALLGRPANTGLACNHVSARRKLSNSTSKIDSFSLAYAMPKSSAELSSCTGSPTHQRPSPGLTLPVPPTKTRVLYTAASAI
jgi:hypothetical protein